MNSELAKQTLNYHYNMFSESMQQAIDVAIEALEKQSLQESRRETGEKIKEAIRHFEMGISHDIFSEPVLGYAQLAVEALKKELREQDADQRRIKILAESNA